MSTMGQPVEILRRLVGVSGRDAGCDRGMDVFDLYVEAEVAGLDEGLLYPDVARHLRACPDCAQDHDGLVALLRSSEDQLGS